VSAEQLLGQAQVDYVNGWNELARTVGQLRTLGLLGSSTLS